MATIKRIGGMSNCYLIKTEYSSILVDTGTASAREKVYSHIKDENIKLIVLTHGHADHIANTAYFSKIFNAPIGMHKDDYPLIENQSCRELYARSISGKFILSMTKKMNENPIERFEPEIYLDRNSSLEEYGIPATICELPGHTKGSIGIKIGGNFIVGDALINFIIPSVSKLYEDRLEVLKSVQFIDESSSNMIFTDHGNPIKRRF